MFALGISEWRETKYYMKITRFKIYPIRQDAIYKRKLDKKSWFDVVIFPTKKLMVRTLKQGHALAFTRSVPSRIVMNLFGTCVKRERKGEKGKKADFHSHLPDGKIGDIVFNAENLTDEIITHECVHAMFRTVHMYTDNIPLWLHESHLIHAEEYMCFCVGEYVKQIQKQIKHLTPRPER